MLTAEVIRTQHAVGHGGFHTGNITLRQRAAHFLDFWYVYDCGSEQSTALRNALRWYRNASNAHTDILFVSHLHSDHINGIEHLQAMAPPKTVVVPYLDLIDRLIFFLSDLDEGSASSSSLEYLEDPVGWWGRRGSKRVVFLEAGQSGGDDPPARPEGPDAPIEDDGEDEGLSLTGRETKEPTGRVAARLKKPRGEVPTGLSPAEETATELGEGAILAGAGSSFQMEWQADKGLPRRTGDWLLLPYVHPANDPTRSAFMGSIKKLLRVRNISNSKFEKRVLSCLKSYEGAKAMRSIYRHHFPGRHNSVSMSLYSGPHCLRSRSRDWEKTWRPFSANRPFDDIYRTMCILRGECNVGWVATGDAELKERSRREPWFEFFWPWKEEMYVINLPHHGSTHNFHDEILFERLEWAIATTIEKRNRVARLGETLAAVQAQGIKSWIVDNLYRNAFCVRCRRELN